MKSDFENSYTTNIPKKYWRREILKLGAKASAISALVAWAWLGGVKWIWNNPKIRSHIIKNPKITKELHGYSLAQFTDMHMYEWWFSPTNLKNQSNAVLHYLETQWYDIKKLIWIISWDITNTDNRNLKFDESYLREWLKEWLKPLVDRDVAIPYVLWNHDVSSGPWGNNFNEIKKQKVIDALEYAGCTKTSEDFVCREDDTLPLQWLWLPDMASEANQYRTSWDKRLGVVRREFNKLELSDLEFNNDWTYLNPNINLQQEKLQHFDWAKKIKDSYSGNLFTILNTHSPTVIDYVASNLSFIKNWVSYSWHTHWYYYPEWFPFNSFRDKAMRKLRSNSPIWKLSALWHGTYYDISKSWTHHTSSGLWHHPDTFKARRFWYSWPWRNIDLGAMRIVHPEVIITHLHSA